jgi:hypothetical protein
MANPGAFKRELKKGVPDGDDVIGVKRALSRAGFMTWQEFDDAWNDKVTAACNAFQKKRGIKIGPYITGTHTALKAANVPANKPNAGQDAFDDRAAALYKGYLVPSKVPNLGSVFAGGQSVLRHDLTHRTSGLPRNGSGDMWPAFDDAFSVGTNIIAPEDLEVFQASSSNPGDACYARGVSRIEYWFGHLVIAPAVGTKLPKGKPFAKVCPNNLGGGPHVHVAVNVERLWGAGKVLTHKTSYQHGAPLIGDQLAAGRPLSR